MISFWISVVPPKIDWMGRAAELTIVAETQRIGTPADQGGLYLGQRELRRSRSAIWAAITRHGIISPRRSSPSRGVEFAP